jgi:hypothetical protein
MLDCAISAVDHRASYGDTPWQEALSSLSKYVDLFYIPVLMMIFREHKTRTHALHALACSLAGIVILSYLIRFGLLPKFPFITGTITSPRYSSSS